MTNYDWQLQKFVMQNLEYTGELKAGNLGMNGFCDVLRMEPKMIIAESDFLHDIEKIGNRLASSWMVTEQRKSESQKKPLLRREQGLEL